MTCPMKSVKKTASAMMENQVSRWQAHRRSSSGGIFSMESHSSRTVVSTWEQTRSDIIYGVRLDHMTPGQGSFSPPPPRSPCLHWRSWCFHCGAGFSACSSSCVWPRPRRGRSCCETVWWEKPRWHGGNGSGGSQLDRSRRRCRTVGGRRCDGGGTAARGLPY